MGYLKISGPVRRELGERDAGALAAGVGLPADAQCWRCGDAINILAAKRGTVCLCVVVVRYSNGGQVNITVWAHAGCGPSEVIPYEVFEATASRKASPVVPDGERLIVDGRQIL